MRSFYYFWLALTSDWLLSAAESGWNRQYPCLSLTQTNTTPTSFFDCPEIHLQQIQFKQACIQFIRSNRISGFHQRRICVIHTLSSSTESWIVFHNIQALSHTRSVTWRLLHKVTNSVSLSLCLEDGDGKSTSGQTQTRAQWFYVHKILSFVIIFCQ